jgi:PTS system nitrogen regulatory IIA component
MELESIIEPNRVLRNVEARSKKHALDILSEMLAGADAGLTQGQVFDSLIGREKLGCTAMDGGVAIPHGCVEGLDKVIGAFVKLGEPVDYDTPDGGPIDMMFAVILPRSDKENYSANLCEIAETFNDPAFLEQLREAKSSRSLYDMLAHHHSTQTATA